MTTPPERLSLKQATAQLAANGIDKNEARSFALEWLQEEKLRLKLEAADGGSKRTSRRSKRRSPDVVVGESQSVEAAIPREHRCLGSSDSIVFFFSTCWDDHDRQ